MAAGKKYPEQVYIEEEKNEKYMEGNYDGDADQQYKQERADKRRSIQMEEDIRASQEAVYEKETERLSYEQKAVGEAFTKIMKEYVEDNIYQQYLVDGAVLRCNQAMTDDMVFTEWGEKVVLENKADEVCNIILNVPENPVYEDDDSENSMMINGLRYATVKDTIKNINIIVPKCNCRLAADRNEEEKRIRNDTDRNKNGVCMHLMRLNEEWDNFEVKDKEGFRIKYAKRVNVAPSPFSAGAGRILDGSEDVVEEKVEGITMTSVLFCKHGGLIMPVTSGQTEINNYNSEIDDNNLGIKDSTRRLIKKFEGNPFVTPRINSNGTFTIGYGYDFTESGDPETFSKFFRREGNSIIVVRNLTQQEIDESIDLAANKNSITKAIDNFINATGNGNKSKPLIMNQNQYDVLFSYFYSNGAYVFTEEIYKQEINKGGENENRAEARKELRDYLIEENGNYNADEIKRLFVNSKGWNIKYDYKTRREEEAEVFMCDP